MQVSILMVRALAKVVVRAGVTHDRFLSAAGLEPALVDDNNARLSLEDYKRVLRAAIAVSGDEAFGLHMGEQTSSTTFDVLGALLERAATLRECIEGISRYSRLVAEGTEAELCESGDTASIRFTSLRGESAAVRLTAEFAMTGLMRMLLQFVGDAGRPTGVCFAYAPPPHLDEYRRIFGGVERFGQDYTEFQFQRAWLDRTQLYPSPDLYAALKTEAERTLGRLERTAVLTDRITGILMSRSPRKIPTMDDVARELDVSVRSLRRRLLAEGATYKELVERCRTNAAKRMLEKAGASIQETAYAMGFATPAAFHHAFKRWTGMTPKQYLASV
jgi:AraC-like DNA-binding protein